MAWTLRSGVPLTPRRLGVGAGMIQSLWPSFSTMVCIPSSKTSHQDSPANVILGAIIGIARRLSMRSVALVCHALSSEVRAVDRRDLVEQCW